MIDLSHLTEEEQGVIMTVLRRDAELKKAEEERVRKLETILSAGSKSDSKLKYLTGEWFYEAKSRRHKDKIHGSEIILASMKQRRAGSEGSHRPERIKMHSSRGSDIGAPRKPARQLEVIEAQRMKNAEKQNPNSSARSPRTPRHNPFNRASLIVAEPTENTEVLSKIQSQDSSEKEPVSPLKRQQTGERSWTSGGSGTSEGSSVGFRPVPKKRTFPPRQSCSQSDSDGSGLEPQGGLPARARGDAPIDSSQKCGDGRTQRERAAVNPVSHPAGSTQEYDRDVSSVTTWLRQEELSLPQSTEGADPPVSYDLNFIDTSDQQSKKKSNQKSVFKLSTQISSPTGDDEGSIAKVLDWFSRSTDSSDWLNAEDQPEVKKSSNRRVEIGTVGVDELLRKDVGDIRSDRKKEPVETKRSRFKRQTSETKEFRATDRTGSKELTTTQEEVKSDAREGMQSQEVKNKEEEKQAPKISQMKFFWESSMMYPKISRSVMPMENINFSVEKDVENTDRPGVYNGKGDERERKLSTSPQKVIKDKINMNHQELDSVHLGKQQIPASQKSDNDQTCVTDHSRLPASPQIADGGVKPAPQSPIRSRLSTESQGISSVQPHSQPDIHFQSRETLLQEERPLLSQLDTELQISDIPASEKSRNSPYSDYKLDRDNVQITPKPQMKGGSNEDFGMCFSEDKSIQSGTSAKRKEDTFNSPQSHRQGLGHQESTAERIKELKSFWEQERNKPVFYSGKAKTPVDGKSAGGANQAKMNKRFTKSEYDLRSIGNCSGGADEDQSDFSLNPRLEKLSPSLSASRTQFHTLREFWDEATSDSKGSLSIDKPKSPKRKEPQETRCGDPELYRLSPKKSPHDRQGGSGPRAANDSKNNQDPGQPRESRRISKDAGKEEKATKPQSNLGKDTRSFKSRKDSSRGSSLRRANSMFTLNVPAEKDQAHPSMDGSPGHKSRKQSVERTQSRKHNIEKGAVQVRSSEDTGTPPRARAFVPTDYRHYLGMTDKTDARNSLNPAVKDEPSEAKAGYEFNLDGPLRASTPVSSEERYGKKSIKMGQRPLWSNYSSSDTGQESSVSSTSENWSTSRIGSNRENVEENPIRKALRRAEARPKNLAKSMEDITASVSPRQERRQDPASDMRRISDVSAITSPSSTLFSDPEHLKEMSKSVPSFLQKEDNDRDTDSSTYEDSFCRGGQTAGNSDLADSSDLASVSSLSGSVMTVYGGDYGNVEVQGNIQFSINYVQKLREFHIFVAQCRDLAAVDPKRGRSDPYVKSYLAPDKAHLGKRKTSVKKKTLNPTFNEILRYRVRMEYLKTQTLILSVWHHDTFGRNSFLGEVEVDLCKWDFDHTQMNYLALKGRTTPSVVPSNERGEMRLAIRFLPQIVHSEGLAKEGSTSGEVHIWVKECKNLPLIRCTVDPYVKCFVLPDTSKKSRQKTRVLRRTVDPVFNHTMVYDGIRGADLTEACVELTVWDRDRLASNLLGGLRLGSGTGRSYGAEVDWMDSTPYEVALWERMMMSPNEWVEDVVPLRMLNSAKTALK
ncbi:uncharacterized protein sytl2b [Aulostomus maculatus]